MADKDLSATLNMTSKYIDIITQPKILSALLLDRSKSTKECSHNIFWATDDYKDKGFRYDDEILTSSVSGDNTVLIIPRVLKGKSEQSARSKDMAEVFTPSWLCNRMNNAADEQWFGSSDIFNSEVNNAAASNGSEASQTGFLKWASTRGKIVFPESKDWKAYVVNTRLEITCGEAPFLVSRYDTTTGEEIPIAQRIGILDRKLRVVKENTESQQEWYEWAEKAYKSVYGYEWQGDSLWLARKALMITYLEYFEDKFFKLPEEYKVLEIAEIISWNLWQMDGLRYVVPGSCHEEIESSDGLLFAIEEPKVLPCPGCEKGDPHLHNGIKCRIMDWEAGKSVYFIDTMKK